LSFVMATAGCGDRRQALKEFALLVEIEQVRA
jgi:hypothetical protein